MTQVDQSKSDKIIQTILFDRSDKAKKE